MVSTQVPAQTTVHWTAWQLHVDSVDVRVMDRILDQLIRPVVADYQQSPWFFIRYWQGGPHLRFRLAQLDSDQSAAVTARLRAELPSLASLRGGEQPFNRGNYLAQAQALAHAEGEGSIQPLRSVGVYPGHYQPEIHRYGGPAMMALTEELFQLSSELVLAALPEFASQSARTLWTLRATVAAAVALGSGAKSRFFAESLHAWRLWARRSGTSAAQLDQLCAPVPSPDPQLVELLVQTANQDPWLTWQAGISQLVHQFQRPELRPGRVLYSHLHMLHNRAGRSIPEEIRSYVWLTQAFPTAVAAHV